ncbi:MAG: TniB family NTP-binding protein [Pyrinomonadaceae bacterium]
MKQDLSLTHLNEKTKALMDLSDELRIQRIRGTHWIGYTRAKHILVKLEELVTHPKTHRMPNLLIVGDTNNGKTMIVNRFQQRYPANDNPSGDAIIYPVMIVQAPPIPDEGRFYEEILEMLSAPYKPKDSPSQKQIQVITILKNISLKILIIDEIHDILAGKPAQQRHFRNTIKYLGNKLKIPIVGVGVKEAFSILQSDPQLANRFEPVILPRWEMGKQYERLLASFEVMLPLKNPSHLYETNMALKLLSMSEGLIGELSSILTQAAVLAIRTKTEQIDDRMLRKIKWIQPSDRKRADQLPDEIDDEE